MTPIIRKIKDLFKYKICLTLYWPFYRLLLICFPKRRGDFKYQVSICLIFKNEAPYLKEWIEYHRLIGVDHFYLYNNNSEDNFRDILEPYIANNIVTLVDFPQQYAQLAAYNDCYRKAKDESKWIGFIDTDEYINLIDSNSIKDFLHKYSSYPAVYFNWRMFGTSGHLEENHNELTIERYTQAWKGLSLQGKTFINNQFNNFKIESVHYMNVHYHNFPLPPVALNKMIMYNLTQPSFTGIIGKAYLTHYWSRSLAFYNYKAFKRGDATSIQGAYLRQQAGYFKHEEINNCTKDFSIQRWLVFLKNRMSACDNA